MAEDRLERKVTVTLATDVVGSSNKIEQNEDQTLQTLRACRARDPRRTNGSARRGRAAIPARAIVIGNGHLRRGCCVDPPGRRAQGPRRLRDSFDREACVVNLDHGYRFTGSSKGVGKVGCVSGSSPCMGEADRKFKGLDTRMGSHVLTRPMRSSSEMTSTPKSRPGWSIESRRDRAEDRFSVLDGETEGADQGPIGPWPRWISIKLIAS